MRFNFYKIPLFHFISSVRGKYHLYNVCMYIKILFLSLKKLNFFLRKIIIKIIIIIALFFKNLSMCNNGNEKDAKKQMYHTWKLYNKKIYTYVHMYINICINMYISICSSENKQKLRYHKNRNDSKAQKMYICHKKRYKYVNLGTSLSINRQNKMVR